MGGQSWPGFPEKPPAELPLEIVRAIIPWNNMTNKLIYNEILTLINEEFASLVAEMLGFGTYTMTTNFRVLMEDRLNNSSNVRNTRIAWMAFIEVMYGEFVEFGLNTWTYAPLTYLRQILRQTMVDVPNVTHRIAAYNVIDIYVTAFYGLSLIAEPDF